MTRSSRAGSERRSTAHQHHSLTSAVVLAACALLAPIARAIAPDDAWRWTHFTTLSGLPNNHVTRVVVSRDDVWAVTTTGVAFYDGHRWTPITHADLPHAGPTALHAIEPGRALAVYREGIWRIEPSGVVTLCTKPEADEIFTTAVPLGADLLVLVSTKSLTNPISTLHRVHDGKRTPFVSPPGGMRNRAGDLWLTESGTLYAASATALYRWSGGQWVARLPLTDWGSRKILSLQENADGAGVLATSLPNNAASVWRWERDQTPIEVPPKDDNIVRAAAIGGKGETLVAYDTPEILGLDGTRWCPYPTPSLTDVQALTIAPNNDLWVATTDGLHLERRGPQPWTSVPDDNGAASNRINEILAASDGKVWFATSRGVLVYDPQAKTSKAIHNAGDQPLKQITGLAEDDRGRIWMSSGRWAMGAYCYDGTWRHFGQAEGLPALCCHKIRRDRHGGLWFLGLSDTIEDFVNDGPGAFVYDGEKFTPWTKNEGMRNGRVYAFCQSADDTLWFGTLGGLARFRNGTWTHWTQADGLRSDRVFALDADASNRVWFSHTVLGLGYIDEHDHPQYLDTADGLSSNEVQDLRFDHEGRLWIATVDGLNVMRDGIITPLHHESGLGFSNLWPVLPLGDRIYVGSLGHGAAFLDWHALDDSPPTVVMRDVIATNNPPSLSWSALGPWGRPREGRVPTRYRIDDGPWSRFSYHETSWSRRVAPGTHTIAVQAKGAYGRLSKVVSLPFAPLPPMYRQPAYFVPLVISATAVLTLGLLLVLRQRAHRRERRRLEAQLLQSQKMEAIGRLAGGIAHDFNNLLTAINGYSDLVLGQLPGDSPARDSIAKIHRAGERAASLTAQLLAFSRKQLVSDRIINLNEIVLDLVQMLRRLLGEDIELSLDLAHDLGMVRADPGQAQQVLLNLTVNARDAMTGGGHLVMRTRNDDRRGEVLLSVSDTGCGITEEHRAHLFEPFYTTKELGKGTGLGLAMVYGVVQQSSGRISVDSEPGCGTTFTIHLPRAAGNHAATTLAPVTTHDEGGTETVLIVEDEPDVRSLMRDTLLCSGYHVLEATDGVHALEVAHAHAEPIHLLLTDVVMPRSSGPELARQLASTHPNTKVLYVSGYTGDARLERHGDERVAFIQKPFCTADLKRRVHEVLHPSEATLAKS